MLGEETICASEQFERIVGYPLSLAPRLTARLFQTNGSDARQTTRVAGHFLTLKREPNDEVSPTSANVHQISRRNGQNPPPEKYGRSAKICAGRTTAEVNELRKICGLLLLSGCFSPIVLRAQGQYYVGALGGIATLSSGGQAVFTPASAASSLYSTRNGPAINFFAGLQLSNYVGLQGNYIWNRNDLTLSSTAPAGVLQNFYQQPRSSSQHSVIADLLVYMRDRGSRVRPYLSGGFGPVHLSSSINGEIKSQGAVKAPPQKFTSTIPGLRVAVGMDVRLNSDWFFRYSFSETISSNAISAQMQPRPMGLLKNFQNLFGIMRTF
jgi:hypothetical protein